VCAESQQRVQLLWSAIEVYRYYEPMLLSVMLWLQLPVNDLASGAIGEQEFREKISEALTEVANECRRSRLNSISDQAEELKKRWLKPEVEVKILIAMVSSFTGNFQRELTNHLFFRIPQEERGFYENLQLNPAAENAFPKAIRDIAAAGRCLALDEATACVLNLMRALEYPLNAMANALNVTINNPNWHQVLKDCEDKISEMGNPPAAANWKEDKEFYSEAALNFRYFKDAWRNHVSHGRHTYDKREAYDIMVHVAGFMDHLATKIKDA